MGRVAGVSLIALVWLIAVYLVAHYSLVFYFGPERLHAALGDKVYNALFPIGGLGLVLSAGLWLAVWAIPLLLAYFLIAACIRTAFGAGRRVLRARVAILSALLVTGSLHVFSLDGWPWWVVPLLVGDDTEFSPTYSAMGFFLVRRGMTSQEVVARAGEPLERSALSGRPTEEAWWWTRSPHSQNYRLRGVVFRDGRVAKKFSEYYLD